MINNYKCDDCKKYIVCTWRMVFKNIFSDNSEIGKNINITIDECKEFDEIK